MTAGILRTCALLLGIVTVPLSSQAHRLDEYLQAMLVCIDPGQLQIQLELTPGVAVADRVISKLDPNRDGVISPTEAASYCKRLRRDLTVTLDGRQVELALVSSSFPAVPELRTGLAAVQIEFRVGAGMPGPGGHEVEVRNRHLRRTSVYLFNAAQPRSECVGIMKQTRTRDQHTGRIQFNLQPPVVITPKP